MLPIARLVHISATAYVLSACGDNMSPVIDATPSWAVVGPLTALPMLADFNQSSEVSVAAYRDHVVVSTIYQRFDSADTFEYPQEGLPRQVAVSTSHDGGSSFGTPSPHGASSSDPVVIVGADGRFWLSVLYVVNGAGLGIVARSDDFGDTFTPIATDLAIGDKEWIAVDAVRKAVFVGAASRFFKLSYDGQVLGEAPAAAPNWNAVAGYVDGDGASRFLTLVPGVVRWDGVTAVQDGPPFDPGEHANLSTIASGAIGTTLTGEQWVVRAVRGSSGALAVVTLMGPSGNRFDLPISAAEETSFLPAATIDAAGRLHVVWYDSSGPTGVLRYTRSVGSDLSQPFLPSIIIDPDACPGQGWYPYRSNEIPPGGRRLREYVGIAVVGERAHIAWTHAPQPPSLVFTTTVDAP